MDRRVDARRNAQEYADDQRDQGQLDRPRQHAQHLADDGLALFVPGLHRQRGIYGLATAVHVAQRLRQLFGGGILEQVTLDARVQRAPQVALARKGGDTR